MSPRWPVAGDLCPCLRVCVELNCLEYILKNCLNKKIGLANFIRGLNKVGHVERLRSELFKLVIEPILYLQMSDH